MKDEFELDIFTYFQLVPHKGLARIIATLEVLGVTKLRYKWANKGTPDYPRIEYRHKNGNYVCALGVSRRPFIGHSSWLSFYATNERNEQSSVIILCFNEVDRIWLREWNRGIIIDAQINALIHTWFPKGDPRLLIEQDGLVNATIQHLIHLMLEADA